MKPYISGKPAFYVKDLVKSKRRGDPPFPLGENRKAFFFSARYALAGAAKALGLKRGDVILLPSYNCGVEIDPFLFLGLDLEFYNVKRDLAVDLDDLAFCIRKRRPKAVIATHFLGFPQAIDEIKVLCKENGVFLIEDCAHAFLGKYKGKALGSYGDVGIYSLLKTLPVPDGGVLLLNTQMEKIDFASGSVPLSTVLPYVLDLASCRSYVKPIVIKGFLCFLENLIAKYSAKSLRISMWLCRKLFHSIEWKSIRPDSLDFVSGALQWGMSDLAGRVVDRINYQSVKDKRRENYRYLEAYFKKKYPELILMPDLPDGVCPLFFPLILKSAVSRQNVYLRLRKRAIVTHAWWDCFHPVVPWARFPEAVFLKERLFGLPVQQNLDVRHLDIMIDQFEAVMESEYGK